MTTAQAFEKLLNNIMLDNDEQLSNRYREITKKLNKTFRDTESETANSLQVGSYGRYTGIKGISDLDMMYIMPAGKWDIYKNDPDKLLRDTRDALIKRYPKTNIKPDTPVVVVNFQNFKFEVQPVFLDSKDEDGLPVYWFPCAKEGKYKKTKPKHEQAEMTRFRQENGETHRRLCKIMRAWKNKSGLAMSGLLMDTLAYNFLTENEDYRSVGLSDFDVLCRDFFAYLKDQAKQDYYLALGSRQYVWVKHPFKNKANNAYKQTCAAIEENDEKKRHEAWREIFGNVFPKAELQVNENRALSAKGEIVVDNEQFIEDYYSMDICEELTINCRISANGFQTMLLRDLLSKFGHVGTIKSLDFYIEKTSASKPYDIRWKIRNVGDVAIQRNCLRGQIEKSNKGDIRHETSNFKGPHFVECYIIKNGFVIAKDRINVPIL